MEGWLMEARREGGEGTEPIALTKLVGDQETAGSVVTSHFYQSDVSLGDGVEDDA
jgi:hypothetical protein